MLDLITGHQGFLHITAEQISEVNRSITAGYGDNAVLRLKDGTLSSTGLSIGIAAGYWRANGFDVEITSAETIYVDPSSVGTSRIDKFYIELLQDIPSGNQRAELVYVKGTEASVPVAPSDPTAPILTTDILLECVCYASALIEENSLSLTDLTKVIQNVTPEDMTLVKSWIRNNADVYSSLVTHDKGEIVLNALDGKVYECVHSCPAYSWEANSQYYEERTIIDILDRINQQSADFHKYGTCPTAASTSEKKVTTRLGDWTLETGKVVYVAFSYTNTAATPTLNVDNTGAKEIKGYGSTAPSSWWKAGDKVQFLYDGVYYIMLPSQGQITDLNNDLNNLKLLYTFKNSDIVNTSYASNLNIKVWKLGHTVIIDGVVSLKNAGISQTTWILNAAARFDFPIPVNDDRNNQHIVRISASDPVSNAFFECNCASKNYFGIIAIPNGVYNLPIHVEYTTAE